MAKKILVIRFSSIGDIVLTTPVLRGLKLQIGAEVHVLTKKAFAPIVEINPHVTKVYTLTEDINDVIGDLKKENYDEVIDLHHNLRSQRIKLALGKPATAFRKLNIEKWLMVQFKINRLPPIHIVDRYLETVSHLGVKPDGLGLDFFLRKEDNVNIEGKFGFKPFGYATMVIGAAHQTKCMTAEQIQQLCNALDMPVILLGGKEEIEKANRILSGINNDKVKSAVGELTILQSASVIEQSGPIITHDTGMMHIAAALKKPQVVVWGNTIPGFGMYPYYGNENIKWLSFEQTDLHCRPCSKLGYDKCPKGHFKCMLEHDISAIASTAKSLIT
ncbi:MAG TPA: glycosyltransferase family 9 protein [Saprospiraceae bacterium]|nr:glycosyltransferase family 9 protein [Saprospiraceae bacterium]